MDCVHRWYMSSLQDLGIRILTTVRVNIVTLKYEPFALFRSLLQWKHISAVFGIYISITVTDFVLIWKYFRKNYTTLLGFTLHKPIFADTMDCVYRWYMSSLRDFYVNSPERAKYISVGRSPTIINDHYQPKPWKGDINQHSTKCYDT